MPDTYRVTTDGGVYNVTVGDSSDVSSPTAAQMIGMMGKAPATVEEGSSPQEPNLISRLVKMAEPMTQPWKQDSAMGRLSGILGNLIPAETPNVLRYFGSAAKDASAAAPKLRNIPSEMMRTLYRRATDTRPLAEVAQSNFNDLPLYRQMEIGPETRASGAIADTSARSAMPRLSDMKPISDVMPKPSLSALDVLRVKQLMQQGIPQEKAVQTVLNLRGQGLPVR